MGGFRLAELSPANLPAATRITLAPGQDPFVAPVVMSVAQAYVEPAAWPRVILDGDHGDHGDHGDGQGHGDVVGFVMARFDPDHERATRRFYLWRLNIDVHAQRRGAGRFAVEEVAAEARRRGGTRLSVGWVPGAGGPEGFYRRLGFAASGEQEHGESIGWLDL